MPNKEDKLDKIIKLLEEIKANQPIVYYPPVHWPPYPYVPYPEPPYITYTPETDGTLQINDAEIIYNS